jgi:hypothetical protein
MTCSRVQDRGRTLTATRVGLSSECRAAAAAALMGFASGSPTATQTRAVDECAGEETHDGTRDAARRKTVRRIRHPLSW